MKKRHSLGLSERDHVVEAHHEIEKVGASFQKTADAMSSGNCIEAKYESDNAYRHVGKALAHIESAGRAGGELEKILETFRSGLHDVNLDLEKKCLRREALVPKVVRYEYRAGKRVKVPFYDRGR